MIICTNRLKLTGLWTNVFRAYFHLSDANNRCLSLHKSIYEVQTLVLFLDTHNMNYV